MVNLPVNLRTPASHDLDLNPAQRDALAETHAPSAVDSEAAEAISEEELMSLNVWGDGPKMLLNSDTKPVANFDSQESAASIFQLAAGSR
jgi:hypothetical protein